MEKSVEMWKDFTVNYQISLCQNALIDDNLYSFSGLFMHKQVSERSLFRVRGEELKKAKNSSVIHNS